MTGFDRLCCRGARLAVTRAKALFLGVAVAAATFGMSSMARAEDPEFLTFGAGAFDINGSDGAPVFNLEYVDDRNWVWHLKPMTGIFATTDGSLYGYAGLSLDLFFGSRVVVTPSFAPGLYYKGGGKDLGHVVEFRSSIKGAYRFDDRSRIGLEFNHLSNAGLDDRNPGANQLMLFYALPFSRDAR